MGNKLRILFVVFLLVFLAGFTGISSAQENSPGLASSSSPEIVKKKGQAEH